MKKYLILSLVCLGIVVSMQALKRDEHAKKSPAQASLSPLPIKKRKMTLPLRTPNSYLYGAQEELKLFEEDPISLEKFGILKEEQFKQGKAFIVVRTETVLENGTAVVRFYHVPSINRHLFGGKLVSESLSIQDDDTELTSFGIENMGDLEGSFSLIPGDGGLFGRSFDDSLTMPLGGGLSLAIEGDQFSIVDASGKVEIVHRADPMNRQDMQKVDYFIIHPGEREMTFIGSLGDLMMFPKNNENYLWRNLVWANYSDDIQKVAVRALELYHIFSTGQYPKNDALAALYLELAFTAEINDTQKATLAKKLAVAFEKLGDEAKAAYYAAWIVPASDQPVN